MGILIIFLDGIGVGERNSDNPLAAFQPRILRCFQDEVGGSLGAGEMGALDACLGVTGLPQSASGQTALFTGKNAARAVGGHVQGFPGRQLKEIIRRHSLFRRVIAGGLRPTFANAYTPRFFSRRPRWISVTTVMTESAEVPLRTLDDLRAERALFMDYTNRWLIQRGVSVPERSPSEAAQILARLAHDHDCTLYEFFLTDLIGHRGSFEEALELCCELDDFLAAVVRSLDLDRCSLLVTSDHGNIEDMSRKTHTRNPVPLFLWGAIREHFHRKRRTSILSVTPMILEFLGIEAESLPDGEPD